MKKNLWQETIEFLEKKRKTWEDVNFVMVNEKTLHKTTFQNLAEKTNYDDENDALYVNESLVVVGQNWFLKRNYKPASHQFCCGVIQKFLCVAIHMQKLIFY